MSFAEHTTVPVEKTRAEIEKLVTKYGAVEFSSGWNGKVASIQFMAEGRRVRFTVVLPDPEWAKDKLMNAPRSRYYDRKLIPAAALVPLVDGEHRRRWRCLLLAIKAKLEIVQSEIATFDEEFLSHVVMDDGKTIFERIQFMADNGQPMLPPISGTH